MQSEQVWQAALGQLQLEMPKTTFDTWVRGTTLLTHEDGLHRDAAQARSGRRLTLRSAPR